MNELQIFNYENNKIRTLEIDNEIWWVASDICKILGYKNTTRAIEKLDDDERSNAKLGRQGNANIVNESGLYTLIFKSEKGEALPFRRWVTHDVLPAIRKTGTFTMKTEPKELEVREQEVKLKTAELLLKVADDVDKPSYKQILQAYATKEITGEFILPLPLLERKTLSATEVGNILGISSNKVGRIANKSNLKIDEYGEWYQDKSPNSVKQVDTFRYYENVIPVFQELLEAN